MKEFEDLTEDEINNLIAIGALDTLYPDREISTTSEELAFHSAAKIFQMVVEIYDEYDIIRIKKHAKNWLAQYYEEEV